MKRVSIQKAKTHLLTLVDRAAKGESFVIEKGGKPLVKVAALVTNVPTRLGFMKGEIEVPDDFDRVGEDEIVRKV